jgi:hypothetical protein
MPKGRRPYLGGLLLGITVARRSCVVEAPALLRLVSPGNTTQRFPPLLGRRCGSSVISVPFAQRYPHPQVGPGVRIRFPPPKSLRTLSPTRDERPERYRRNFIHLLLALTRQSDSYSLHGVFQQATRAPFSVRSGTINLLYSRPGPSFSHILTKIAGCPGRTWQRARVVSLYSVGPWTILR